MQSKYTHKIAEDIIAIFPFRLTEEQKLSIEGYVKVAYEGGQIDESLRHLERSLKNLHNQGV